jgi:hypothetical protein
MSKSFLPHPEEDRRSVSKEGERRAERRKPMVSAIARHDRGGRLAARRYALK